MYSVFFGHDDRTPVGSSAFVQSIIRHARYPVAICPITRAMWPDMVEGTNSFTARRFLVPFAMRFNGWAAFVDGSDMICRADISDIFQHRNYNAAVQVVKHDYKTRHHRKYVGTEMEADNVDYIRKQWASVMLINCTHFIWRRFTPEYIKDTPLIDLLQLRCIPDDRIGSLPTEWNWLADEHGQNDDAKIVHYTAGIPAMHHYRDSPMADDWFSCAEESAYLSGDNHQAENH